MKTAYGMGSRLRQSPKTLFEVFLEIGKPTDPNGEPFILTKFPEDYNSEDVLHNVSKFAFPCETDCQTVDHFTFVLTDDESKFRFIFCRHATGAQTCLCILSFLPWYEVFYQLLNTLAEVLNRSENNNPHHLLTATYTHDVPMPSIPVTIVAKQEMISFTAPDPNKLHSIPSSRNLTEYYNALDPVNMMMIFASMLHERRIIITSKKLSRITSCIHAASALLYPLEWQHLYIPVLPLNLLDYVSAPMPYVIGVHHNIMDKVKRMELGDAVIIDADKNEVYSEYADIDDLPSEIASYLKSHLKTEKLKKSMQTSPDALSRAFLLSLVRLIGGYRDALRFRQNESIIFDHEVFVQSRPPSMRPYLESMIHLQLFQQFINGRLDMLNCGEGFSDLFEVEVMKYADKFNTNSRYKEWLTNMKKQGKKLQRGGKDIWSDFKLKAAPVMSTAVQSVRHQGKKAFHGMKTKIGEMRKDEKDRSDTVQYNEHSKSYNREIRHTIVGEKIIAQRDGNGRRIPPPRPPLPFNKQNAVMTDRSNLYTTMEDDELSVQDETDGLFQYQRVSVGLQNDPDLKQFYVKSSSYEDLTIGPYHEPLIDSSDSTPSTGRNTPEEHSNRDTFKGKLNSTLADNLIKSQKSQDDSVIQTGKAIPMPLPRKSLSTKKFDNSSGKVPLAPPRRNRSPMMYVENETSHVKLDSSVSNTKSSNESVTSEKLIQGNKHNVDESGDRLIRSNVNRTKNTQNKRSGVYQAGDFTDYPEKTSTSVSGNEEKSESSTKLVREVSINRSPAFRRVPRKSPLRQSFKQDKEEMDDMDIFDPLATEVRSENNSSFSCSNPVYEQYEIKKKVETQSCDLLQDWNVNQLVGQSSSTTVNKPQVPSPHRGMSNSISNPYYSRSNQPLQNNIPPPLPPKPSNLRATSMYSTHGPYITPQTAQIPVSPIIQSSGVNNRTSDPFDDLHSLTLQQGKQSGNTSPKPPSPNPRWEQFD